MLKNLLYILGISAICGQVQGQSLQANDELKNLIGQAFSFFPKINEAQNSIQTAQMQVDLASNTTLNIAGEADYTYVRPKIMLAFPLGENGALESFQFAPVHNGNAAVSASYTLFDFGRLKANIDKAKTDLKLATDNVDYVKNQLAFQVANIYYNIVYYRKAIAIQDSVISYLTYNKQIIDSKLRNGDAIKIDLLNIQSSLDNEQNTRINLQDALQKQLNLLRYCTNNDSAAGNAFDFSFALTNEEQAFLESQQHNPDFQLARDRIAQADANIATAKLQMKPSVDVHGATGFKNGYVPNVNELRYNYQAGVTLRVPIYNGNRMKKEIALDQSIKRQNELQLETLNNEYRKDIRQALTDIYSNQQSIQNTAGQIEQSIAAEQLATSRFRNGVGTNLEITNASTNVQKAEFSRLQYEYQLCLAKLQLSRLLGWDYWK